MNPSPNPYTKIVLGKWLSDLPLQFPEKQLSLHGIDIGSDLFSARPTNVTTDLRKHNLLHPIPESWGWDESFDVVHQRLLVWAFKKSEWSTVVGNLLKLLKPGGYIQLVEVEWDDKSTDRSPMFQKHTTLYTYRGIQAGMDTDIAYRLEDLLRDAGCKDVTKVQFDHGFGKMAREKEFVESSAQLLIQGFRPLGGKCAHYCPFITGWKLMDFGDRWWNPGCGEGYGGVPCVFG